VLYYLFLFISPSVPNGLHSTFPFIFPSGHFPLFGLFPHCALLSMLLRWLLLWRRRWFVIVDGIVGRWRPKFAAGPKEKRNNENGSRKWPKWKAKIATKIPFWQRWSDATFDGASFCEILGLFFWIYVNKEVTNFRRQYAIRKPKISSKMWPF